MLSGMPSIYLEYGVDEDTCGDGEFKICERGMSFKSRWRFDLGAELAISLAYHDGDSRQRRIQAQGTVVACEPLCPKCSQITLLFVDADEELRAAIAEVSSRLERAPNDAGC